MDCSLVLVDSSDWGAESDGLFRPAEVMFRGSLCSWPILKNTVTRMGNLGGELLWISFNSLCNGGWRELKINPEF